MDKQPLAESPPTWRSTTGEIDVGHFVQEARRLRSVALAQSLVGVARAIRDSIGTLAAPIAAWLGRAAPVEVARSALIRQRERRRVRRELATYSDAELLNDLRLTPADIDAVAKEAADDLLEATRRAARRSASIGRKAAYVAG